MLFYEWSSELSNDKKLLDLGAYLNLKSGAGEVIKPIFPAFSDINGAAHKISLVINEDLQNVL